MQLVGSSRGFLLLRDLLVSPPPPPAPATRLGQKEGKGQNLQA
jgi:hypothetical protein